MDLDLQYEDKISAQTLNQKEQQEKDVAEYFNKRIKSAQTMTGFDELPTLYTMKGNIKDLEQDSEAPCRPSFQSPIVAHPCPLLRVQ